MIKEIIIATVSTIVSSILIMFISKLYFGYKNFGGIRKTARLTKDCNTAGIINVFPDRKTYIEHKDHGNSSEYISKAQHSVVYVGYWLATATEIGELTNTINSLIAKQITVTLVFISSKDTQSLEICSKYVAIKPDQIATRVNNVIENLLEFKKSLEPDLRRYLVIKTHNVPLSATAFILDHTSDDCRILIDYKLFNGNRNSTYGIEYKGNKKEISQKLLHSYLSISKCSLEIDEI